MPGNPNDVLEHMARLIGNGARFSTIFVVVGKGDKKMFSWRPCRMPQSLFWLNQNMKKDSLLEMFSYLELIGSLAGEKWQGAEDP